MSQGFRSKLPILLVVTMAIAAAGAFAPVWAGQFTVPAVALAVLTLIGAVWLSWDNPALIVEHITVKTANTTNSLRHTITLSLIGGGLLTLVTFWQLTSPPAEIIQFIAWLGGVTILTLGLSGVRPWDWRWHHLDLRLTLRLAVLFVAALLIRLIGLEGWLRVLVDEMQVIAPIITMWDANLPLLAQIDPTGYPYPYIYPFMQQGGSALFGYSLYSFRVTSALAGALTVLSTFALARVLFNQQIAWLTGIALAALPMHLHFSRLGIVNIYDPLLATLAFVFVLQGFRSKNRRGWVLAGACLGLTHYLYEGGRLLHTPLAVLWVGLMWASSRIGFSVIARRSLATILRGVGWMLLTSLLVAAPLYITWLGTDVPVFGRLASQAATDTPPLLETSTWAEEDLVVPTGTERIRDSYLLYVSLVDEWMFYGGSQPMVPVFVVPFFLVGLGVALLHRQRWAATALPALWVLATATATGLFIWNPTHAARHTVALPAVAMLIALGVWLVTNRLFEQPGRQQIAAYTLVGLLAAGQVTYYYANHLPAYNFQARWVRNYADPDDAVLRMADLPPNTHNYIVVLEGYFPPEHPQNLLAYISDGTPPPLTLVLTGWLTEDFLRRLPRDVNHAFFVETGINNAEAIDNLLAAFPDLQPSFSPDEAIALHYQMALFFVPALETDEDVPSDP